MEEEKSWGKNNGYFNRNIECLVETKHVAANPSFHEAKVSKWRVWVEVRKCWGKEDGQDIQFLDLGHDNTDRSREIPE
jgi:hypothetical protein